jgi:hypothetical protein
MGSSMMITHANVHTYKCVHALLANIDLNDVKNKLLIGMHSFDSDDDGVKQKLEALMNRDNPEVNKTPYIVHLRTSYDPNLAKYAETLRPVTALLVIPLQSLASKANIFHTADDKHSIKYEWSPLYPSQTHHDKNAGVWPLLHRQVDTDATNPPSYLTTTKNNIGVQTYVNAFVSGDADKTTWASATIPDVAVIGLGVGEVGGVGGKDGNELMVSTHPLFFFSDHLFDPRKAYVSHGAEQPLKNAMHAALRATHIDGRFLFASMSLLQRMFSTAYMHNANLRRSIVTNQRFRLFKWLLNDPLTTKMSATTKTASPFSDYDEEEEQTTVMSALGMKLAINAIENDDSETLQRLMPPLATRDDVDAFARHIASLD